MKENIDIEKSWITCFAMLGIINHLHGQFSAYHGIVFPYDNPEGIINSAGSITYASPDYSGNIQNNQYSVHGFNKTLPPYCIAVKPNESFESRKCELMFNVGFTYTF